MTESADGIGTLRWQNDEAGSCRNCRMALRNCGVTYTFSPRKKMNQTFDEMTRVEKGSRKAHAMSRRVVPAPS